MDEVLSTGRACQTQFRTAAGSVQPAASDDFVINNKQLTGGGFVQLDPEKTFKNGALYLAISSPSKSFKQGHFVESIGVFFFNRASWAFYLDGRSNKRCSTRSNTFPQLERTDDASDPSFNLLLLSLSLILREI